MHDTLVEVLGHCEYSLDWLRDRVQFHIDCGAVFVAEGRRLLGQTIVREEDGKGLFSTTYVIPEARRLGVAEALLDQGEHWMRLRGMRSSRTYTSMTNVKLIRLFEKRGYGVVLTNTEKSMVVLERSLENHAPAENGVLRGDALA